MSNIYTRMFADLISGYLKKLDWDNNIITLETSDNILYKVKLTSKTYAEITKDLNKPYINCTNQLKKILSDGTYLQAYGIFQTDNKHYNFEAKHIVTFEN